MLVMIDTHWFTTSEHIVAGHEHHKGVYTSEELPIVIRDLAYDYPGMPELAQRVQDIGRADGHRVLNARSAAIAHPLPDPQRRPPPELDQAGVVHRHLSDRRRPGLPRLRRRASPRRSTPATSGSRIIGSGGMSHRFWPLREFLDHSSYDPSHVRTPEARAFDEKMIGYMLEGRHADIIDAWPDYREFAPEGKFGHYLTVAGALGGRDWTDGGEQLSNYENSYGTGQVHVWFDVARAGAVAP